MSGGRPWASVTRWGLTEKAVSMASLGEKSQPTPPIPIVHKDGSSRHGLEAAHVEADNLDARTQFSAPLESALQGGQWRTGNGC